MELITHNKIKIVGKFVENWDNNKLSISNDKLLLKKGGEINYKDYDGVDQLAIIDNIIKVRDFEYTVIINTQDIYKDIALAMLFTNTEEVKYNTHIARVLLDKNAIYLECYNNKELDEFLINHKYFNSYKTINAKGLYKFFVPDKYKEDLELLYDGKYSRLSNTLKSATLSFCAGYPIVFSTGETKCKSTSSKSIKDKLTYINRVFKKSKYLIKELEVEYNIDKLPKGIELAKKPELYEYN